MIDSLDALADRYTALLCDVWGVIHNGVEAHDAACAALSRARAAGKVVVLITNSPRPHQGVEEQLDLLGVPRDAWDRVVTSGDVTRDLIRAAPRRLYHIGPERDGAIFDGLDVELVEDFEASGVVCTGLFDDENETPEDYAESLQRLRMRDLPFICANPDIIVERGDRHIWCAGALARDYGLLGGRTLIAGKPHRPIYDAAFQAAGAVLGRELVRGEALGIGDGVLTDVKGADSYGLDVLFVTAGIHARDYGAPDSPDAALLAAFLEKHGHTPVAAITRLR
ncbi:HAD family hydrolase [Nitratireductor pacificus pht-3B]|uniref:HAD family hydrolase n=2 Tax=Nitratireductor TaxID=245876 RepID=K2LSJ9_9HYPH|nr:TIGR01459 family HAD-type hydrolase [Nitratireductor pacificus]EKF20709.1 HAD family hydrolase [Nitratireductor pacificus pht-3B]